MNLATVLLVLASTALVVLLIVVGVQSRRGRPFSDAVGVPINALAVLALVSAFVVSLAAVIMGHIALSQIKRTHERGWAIAVTALVIGYLGLAAGSVGLYFLLRQLAPYM